MIEVNIGSSNDFKSRRMRFKSSLQVHSSVVSNFIQDDEGQPVGEELYVEQGEPLYIEKFQAERSSLLGKVLCR